MQIYNKSRDTYNYNIKYILISSLSQMMFIIQGTTGCFTVI